jgi:hypothetical protein
MICITKIQEVAHSLEAMFPLLAIVCLKVEDIFVLAPVRCVSCEQFFQHSSADQRTSFTLHVRTEELGGWKFVPRATRSTKRLEVPIHQADEVWVHGTLCLQALRKVCHVMLPRQQRGKTFLILGVHELERVLERITDDSLASTKNEAQVLRKAVRDFRV